MEKKLQLNEDLVMRMIDSWHESDSEEELHEYLGLTIEEYKQFVKGDYENIN